MSGDESPSLGPPSVLIKRPGVLLTLLLRGHCLVVFLVVSLHGRGSKLVTVCFHLQRRVFSSCWGGMGSLLGGRKSPHLPPASLLMVYRLQRETRRLVEAVIFHTSFPLRELSVDPHTCPLLLPLSSFSNVSHLFLRVVLREESVKSKGP